MFSFGTEFISITDKELLQFGTEKAKKLKKENPGYWGRK